MEITESLRGKESVLAIAIWRRGYCVFLCAMSFVSAFSSLPLRPFLQDIASSLIPLRTGFFRSSALPRLWRRRRSDSLTHLSLLFRLAFLHVMMITIGGSEAEEGASPPSLSRMGHKFSTDQSVRGKRKSIPEQGTERAAPRFSSMAFPAKSCLFS